MRNAAAPMTGGARIAPMPADASTAPRGVRRISGAPHQRPGDRPEHHGVGDAAAGHGAEQVAGDRHRAARSCAVARSADRGHRPVHEEAAGAAVFEHGAIDREEDDVGGRHVERHAEDALERHVERADEARDRVAAVGDEIEADPIEQRAVVAVDQKQTRGDRQHPPRRSSCGLEDEAIVTMPSTTSVVVGVAARCTNASRSTSGHVSATSASTIQSAVDRDRRAPSLVDAPSLARTGRSTTVRNVMTQRQQQEADAIEVRLDVCRPPSTARTRRVRTPGRT